MPSTARRLAATLVAAATLLLSGCFVSPGSFTSAIDLRRDGRFSYSYTGEIYLLGLSKLAEMGSKMQEQSKWKPSPCFKEGASLDERPCTPDELDQQKADWAVDQKSSAERRKRDASMMTAMLGGIDPTSPRAADELAARLRRQAGWRSVVYKGDGLFAVDFAIAGHLDYDFQFPTMEGFPMANVFVVLNKRADGAVRLDAPAFGQPAQGNPLANMGQFAAMGAAVGAGQEGKDGARPNLPEFNGTLVLTTDGTILANNTDEGPQADPANGLTRLDWKVDVRTTAAPTALIKLK
jgi:hypothetical protein